MTDAPTQSDIPERVHDDEEQIEAAIDELRHFIHRADTSPDISTLDANLQRCLAHLRSIVNRWDRQQDELEEILDKTIKDYPNYAIVRVAVLLGEIDRDDFEGDLEFAFETTLNAPAKADATVKER